MMKHEQTLIFGIACDILAARSMQSRKPKDPDAYRRQTKAQKHTEHADEAGWYFANRVIDGPEHLADLLEPPPPEDRPEPPNPTSAIGPWDGPAYAGDELEPDEAKERIATIRAALKERTS